MTAEGHNVDATLMALGRDHGHYFQKKTFGKPTYCHHCCDKIWGMLTQGYACEGTFFGPSLKLATSRQNDPNCHERQKNDRIH